MSYILKTLYQLNKELGITIKAETELYINVEPVELTKWFIDTMEMAYIKAIRINTETSRQALIVDHVLMELNQHVNISFFLENSFNVDSSKGLTGNPDGIITNNDNKLYISSLMEHYGTIITKR